MFNLVIECKQLRSYTTIKCDGLFTHICIINLQMIDCTLFTLLEIRENSFYKYFPRLQFLSSLITHPFNYVYVKIQHDPNVKRNESRYFNLIDSFSFQPYFRWAVITFFRNDIRNPISNIPHYKPVTLSI